MISNELSRKSLYDTKRIAWDENKMIILCNKSKYNKKYKGELIICDDSEFNKIISERSKLYRCSFIVIPKAKEWARSKSNYDSKFKEIICDCIFN